jgi:hypothetical protein
MHQEQPLTSFLHRYESICGSWVLTELDSQVSKPIQAAMNTILLKDGILAFIGTKSEFGIYELELRDLREATSTGFWTSLPEHTVLATLGLFLTTSAAGRRTLVFYGSPRTLMLSVMIDYHIKGLLSSTLLPLLERCVERHESFKIGFSYLENLELDKRLIITHNELQDSFLDFARFSELTFKKHRRDFTKVEEPTLL